ncbi:hypothetical protein SGPA1_21612 [Streptomyces misionensis JCM 4497]
MAARAHGGHRRGDRARQGQPARRVRQEAGTAHRVFDDYCSSVADAVGRQLSGDDAERLPAAVRPHVRGGGGDGRGHRPRRMPAGQGRR